MAATHERHVEEQIEGPSNRAFGLTVGGILLAIVALRWWFLGYLTVVTSSLSVIGMLLVVLGLLAPGFLEQPNRLWTALGVLLFRIVNPVIMFLIYITTFVPIGLFKRWRGYDPLALRTGRKRESHWISREDTQPGAEAMRHQF